MALAPRIGRARGAPRRRGRSVLLGAIALLVVMFAAGTAKPGPVSAQPLNTGIGGLTEFPSATLDELRQTGSSFVRLTLPWQHVAPKAQPAGWNPSDPTDGHYNWSFFDASVRAVAGAGLEPFVLVEGAPSWAQRCASPPNLQYLEVCDPDPAALAAFATAAARRYSGAFGGLPRVRYWQGMNEPNLTLFFFPQFDVAGKPLSPGLYRNLINAFYAAVKGVSGSNIVVAAGLGPIAVKGWTIGPMQFTRELLCMRGGSRPRPIKGRCRGGVHFDVFDIHPYTTGGPTHRGGRNDVQLGDLKKLQRLIAAADRAGRIKGNRKRTEIWVGELSWDSKPPDPRGLPMKIETRWIAEALYTSWSAGVSNFIWYGLRDEPPVPGVPRHESLESGLFFHAPAGVAAKPKPLLRAYRFPFVAYGERGKLRYWGRTPTSRPGTVRVQVRRAGRWRTIRRSKASKAGIFRGTISTAYGGDKRGAARAVFRGEASPAFSMRPVRDFYQPPFGKPTG